VIGHPSISRQLIWRLFALYAVALIISSAVILYGAWMNRIDDLDRSLRDAASQLAGAAQLGRPAVIRIPRSASQFPQLVAIPGVRYAVTNQNTGAVAEGSSVGLLQDLTRIFPRDPPEAGFDFTNAEGQRERGYRSTVARDDIGLQIVVSSPNFDLRETIAWMRDESIKELLPILAPLFVGTLLIAPLTIRRSLSPLDRLSAQAATIEPSRTDVRLKESGIPSEILPLVQTMNRALARIDDGFERQRRFTTNAAHELRTPLAILRARIDGLEEGASKTGLTKDVERMTRLVNQLLLAGRLEMHPPPLDSPVDLAEVARETVARLEILEASKDHELILHLPRHPVIIKGDAESIGDALRNLIDNAVAYSPTGLPVYVAVTPDGAVEVRDRGPGVPAEHRQQIFDPFWRARKSDGEGAGLGLSIVRSIVARHGGKLEVSDNPPGGAAFRMAFPLA
jgi:two-component system sensor histidine kinase TctE